MHTLNTRILFALSVIALAVAGLVAASSAATPPATLDPALVRTADIVVSGVVVGDPEVTVGESFPAVYWYRFTLRDTAAVKGVLPKNASIVYTVRGDDHTPIKKGDHLLLALRKLDQNLEKKTNLIDVLGKVPFTPGASAAAGRIVKKLKPLGPKVTMTIEQIAPKTPIKWTNPYGDGRFRVVITNRGKTVRVPAVIAHTPYGSKQIRPAKLMRSGTSQSFEVDALELPWKNLPGGARLTITVQTADKSVSSFFYFKYDHHMPMLRAKQPNHKR